MSHILLVLHFNRAMPSHSSCCFIVTVLLKVVYLEQIVSPSPEELWPGPVTTYIWRRSLFTDFLSQRRSVNVLRSRKHLALILHATILDQGQCAEQAGFLHFAVAMNWKFSFCVFLSLAMVTLKIMKTKNGDSPSHIMFLWKTASAYFSTYS